MHFSGKLGGLLRVRHSKAFKKCANFGVKDHERQGD